MLYLFNKLFLSVVFSLLWCDYVMLTTANIFACDHLVSEILNVIFTTDIFFSLYKMLIYLRQLQEILSWSRCTYFTVHIYVVIRHNICESVKTVFVYIFFKAHMAKSAHSLRKILSTSLRGLWWRLPCPLYTQSPKHQVKVYIMTFNPLDLVVRREMKMTVKHQH